MTQYRAVYNPDGEGFLVQRRSWWAPWWRTKGTTILFRSLTEFTPDVFKTREAAAQYIERVLSPPVIEAGRLL